MKKFVAIVVMVILVMSLTVTAQAEGRFVGVTAVQDEYSGKMHYYASVKYSRGFLKTSTYSVLIDEHAYNAFLIGEEKARAAHDNLWYVKAGKWVNQTASDAADWITFWN